MVKRKSREGSISGESSSDSDSSSSSLDSPSSDENITFSKSAKSRATQRRRKIASSSSATPKRRLRSSEPRNGFNAPRPVSTETKKKKKKKEVKCPNCKGMFVSKASLGRHKSRCPKLALADNGTSRGSSMSNPKTATKGRPKKNVPDADAPVEVNLMSTANPNTKIEASHQTLVAKKRGRPKKSESSDSRRLSLQKPSTTTKRTTPPAKTFASGAGIKSASSGASNTETFRCSLCGNVYRTMDSLKRHTLNCYTLNVSDDESSDVESEANYHPQQETEETQPQCSSTCATPPNEVVELDNPVQVPPVPTQGSPDVFIQPPETPPLLEFPAPQIMDPMESPPGPEIKTEDQPVRKFEYLEPAAAPMLYQSYPPQPQIHGSKPLQLGVGFEQKRVPDLQATTYPSWSNNLNPVPSTHADSQRQLLFESPVQAQDQHQRKFNDIMACVIKDSPGFNINPINPCGRNVGAANYLHSTFQSPNSNFTPHISAPASSNMISELHRLMMNPSGSANYNQLNSSYLHLRHPHQGQIMIDQRQTQPYNPRQDINHNENPYGAAYALNPSSNQNLNYSAFYSGGAVPSIPQQETAIPDWTTNLTGYSNQNHRFGGGVYGSTSGGYYPNSIPSNSSMGMQVVSMVDAASGQILSFQVPYPYGQQPESQPVAIPSIQHQYLYPQQMSVQNYQYMQQQQQLQLQIQQNEQQIAAVRLLEQQQQQQSLQSGAPSSDDQPIKHSYDNPFTSEKVAEQPHQVVNHSHDHTLQTPIHQNMSAANPDQVVSLTPPPTSAAAANYIVEPSSSTPPCPQPSILTDLIKMVSPQVPDSPLKSRSTSTIAREEVVSQPVGTETTNSVQNELEQPINSGDSNSKQTKSNPKIQGFIMRREKKWNGLPPKLKKPKMLVGVRQATLNATKKRLRDSIHQSIETVVANCMKSPEKGNPNVAVVRPSVHLVASTPNQPTQENSPSLIKVTLKRKEGADSYSIDNVVNPGVPGSLVGSMRNLKIKARITCGESAGVSSDIVVWPVIITKRLAGAGDSKLGTATHQLVINYEVRKEETVLFRSSDVHAVWNYIFETVQGATVNHSLPPLSFPAALFALPDENNEAQLRSIHLELAHRAVQFLLTQLPGPDTNTCARTEGFKGRKPFDMFAWLASKHRTPLFSVLRPNLSKMAKLPMAQMYRNLIRQGTKHLFVLWSKIHGRGLFSRVDIDEGDMVIEYAGEVIRTPVCDRREKWYNQKGIDCFMFKMDDDYVVDASLKGNAARFINHSCEPNCKSKIVEIMGKKHILIFSIKRIPSGEELTYDYKFAFEDVKIPCHCGSSKCRKFLN